MFQNLIHSAIITIFSFIWGFPLYLYIFRINRHIRLDLLSVVKILFGGLCILSILASWICLFFPIKFWIAPISTIGMLLLEASYIKQKKIRVFFENNFGAFEKITFFICLSLFLFLSAGKPTLHDQYLYHVQAIKWTTEFGTVAGIANLYPRYGFYSNWFNLISFFRWPFSSQNFTYLNCTICIWALLYLVYNVRKYMLDTTQHTLRIVGIYSFFVLVYMLFEWQLFRGSSSSSSYDFIITALSIIILDIILKRIIQPNTISYDDFFLVVYLVSLPFFKLSGILSASVILVWLVISRISIKKILLIITAFIITAIPFLYKNFIQTGYPLFPFTFFQLNNPDWKVPLSIVKRLNKAISLSNFYINQPIPNEAWGSNAAFSYWKNWFLFLNIQDKILIILACSMPAIALIKISKAFRPHFWKLSFLYLICFIALSAWIIYSPDPRFVFGILLFTSLFSLAIVFTPLMKNTFLYIFLFALISSTIFYFYKKTSLGYSLSNIIYPEKYQPPFKILKENNNEYFIVNVYKENLEEGCYDLPIPCLYQKSNLLQPRGKNIKEGFKYLREPDEEFIKTFHY